MTVKFQIFLKSLKLFKIKYIRYSNRFPKQQRRKYRLCGSAKQKHRI
jgi:hypothetical protein